MKTPADILADQIRAGMEARSMTQQALSDALGGSPSQSRISKILQGSTPASGLPHDPRWSTVCRIAEKLGMEIGTDGRKP